MSRKKNPNRFFKKCSVCGGLIKGRNHLRAKHCSKKCYSESQRGKPGNKPLKAMKRAAAKIATLPPRYCQQCGKRLLRKKHKAGGGILRWDTAWKMKKRKYCSHKCLWAAKVHSSPSRIAIYGRMKKVKLSKTARCARCGRTDKLCKHHDDYGRPLDIRVLCRSCHTIEHWDRGDIIGPRLKDRECRICGDKNVVGHYLCSKHHHQMRQRKARV